MKQETIIKKDSDRKTEINRCIVNVPSDLKEMYEWTLTEKSSEMEKYIHGRRFEDWEKGYNVSVQSKLDSRKKELDPVIVAIKKSPKEMKEIYRKMSTGEQLNDAEKKIVTSLLGTTHTQKK